MNQTKIEIKSCRTCKMMKERTDNYYDEFSTEYHCDYYNETLIESVYHDPTYKPDFCKVKNIIVEEE